jgi:hypothetical protein
MDGDGEMINMNGLSCFLNNLSLFHIYRCRECCFRLEALQESEMSIPYMKNSLDDTLGCILILVIIFISSFR